MLELRNISKIYQTKTRRVAALDGVSFALPEKGFVFILGRSGSGKTTMLNMLGGLDAPTEGELLVDGVSSRDFKQADFDNYRNRYVGFVFQEYHLLDDYTVADNIALALELQGDLTQEERQQKIAAALAQVDLTGYGDRNTGELSGGQKQRVAIARALVKDPPMILADEPTGALDRKTGRQLFDLLKAISKDKLVVVVSHDEDFAHEYADRIIELEVGKIIADTDVSEPADETTTSGEKPLHTKTLSVKNALQRAFTGIKRRKVRFAAVSLLCTVAFLLVGAADLLAGYDKRTVLINSLYQQKPAHVSLRKEAYLTYDMSEPNPLLPSWQAVEWYQNQNAVKLKKGESNWYGEYQLTESDLEEIQARFGRTVYGIYVPRLRNMSLMKNYAAPKQYERTDAGRLPGTLTGFMELTDAGMEDLGLSLVAGRLPNGSKNEIAISKYVYEAFVLAGYSNYTGPRYDTTYYTKENQELGRVSLSWDEYLKQWKELSSRAALREKWGDEYHHSLGTGLHDGGVINTAQVTAPEDLIGKTLFIVNQNYTITGIVDTHFDSDIYADISAFELEDPSSVAGNARKDLIETLMYERKNGLPCLAFVGEGKLETIAAEEPRALNLENMSFTIMKPAEGAQEEMEYSTNILVDISTISEEIYPLPTEVSINTAYISKINEYDYMQKDVLLAHIQKAVMSFGWKDEHSLITGGNWKIASFAALSEYCDYHTAERLCPLGDSVILHPYLFDLFTEGRAGIYSHCILPMSEDRGAITAMVDASLRETGGFRYPLGSMVTDQLNEVDGFLGSLADMTQYLGVLVAAFAMAVFAMFTILSIREKKQQIGIMRALGASSRDVFAIFFTEGLLVAAVSAVLATALTAITAIVGSALLRNLFDLRLTLLNFSVRQAVMIFALSFGIAIVASIIPILRIARQKPVDAIRKN